MDKTATCSCGQLSIQTQGKPDIIAACSCKSCQVRSGSAFALNSYYKEHLIGIQNGESKEFQHLSDTGKSIVRSFCPHCGTTVFWRAELLPGYVGIAIGCFADASYPEPKISVWNKSKHHWVSFPDHWMHLEGQDIEEKNQEISAAEPLKD